MGAVGRRSLSKWLWAVWAGGEAAHRGAAVHTVHGPSASMGLFGRVTRHHGASTSVACTSTPLSTGPWSYTTSRDATTTSARRCDGVFHSSVCRGLPFSSCAIASSAA